MAAEFISMEDFKRLDLRVGKVVGASRVLGADKLLQLEVDLGTERKATVAAIAKHYTPEELVGKLVVLLVNLQPAKIRGILSEGMVLAALDGATLALVTVDREVSVGARVM